ncbi:hypothetical protein BKA70DRAFT_1279295 [Coprinopsis sp. MPI-PUGE-AT-0042]|nr:hypothetical protein BKA70DRAFT_1279295 [Coprinopsis sp. MPI-PUGE-AT-0042]
MGKIDHRDREVVNDHEEEEHRVKFRLNLQREPSPQRSSRIPPPNKFTLLGARAQFAYTKSVLQAILKDEYAPIRAKRQALMRGGKDAFKVTKMSTRRGLMDPRFVEDLGACVSHWCLREQLDVRAEVDEGEGDLQVVAAAEPPSEPVTGATSDTTIPVDEVEGEAQVSVSVDPPSPVATELVEVPSSPVLEPPSSSLSPFPDVPSSQIVEDTAQGSDPSPDLMEIEPTVPESVLSSEAPETVRDAPTPASTRQIGSPDYEDLHDKDKLSFCLDILLPEAIRQILLFWSGKRTSPDLLSPEEEQKLFNDGEELLNQRDWVWDVLRVRETKEKIYERKLAKRSGGDLESANSRAGRTRKKVNYGDMC